MSQESGAKSGNKAGRGFLIASGICAAAFIINVLVGKFSVSQGALNASGLGDVGEFFVLLIAVVLFIVACLARERAAKAEKASGN